MASSVRAKAGTAIARKRGRRAETATHSMQMEPQVVQVEHGEVEKIGSKINSDKDSASEHGSPRDVVQVDHKDQPAAAARKLPLLTIQHTSPQAAATTGENGSNPTPQPDISCTNSVRVTQSEKTFLRPRAPGCFVVYLTPQSLVDTPELLAAVLQRDMLLHVAANDRKQLLLQQTQHSYTPMLTAFHSVEPPSLGIDGYLARIIKFAAASPACYLVALVYLRRMARLYPQYAATSTSVHRLTITAVMLAAKFYDDKFYTNRYYARIGGISLPELNFLESEMLAAMDFRLMVSREELAQCEHELLLAIAAECDPSVAALQTWLACAGFLGVQPYTAPAQDVPTSPLSVPASEDEWSMSAHVSS